MQIAPEDRGLRARVISLLHRLVECLGPAALPALPGGLQALLPPKASASALTDVLALLHQLAVRYKAALEPLLAEVRPGALLAGCSSAAAHACCIGRAARQPNPCRLHNTGCRQLPFSGAAHHRSRAVQGTSVQCAQAFPAAMARFRALLPPGWDWSGGKTEGATSEEAREFGDVQKALYSLLAALVNSSLSGALLAVCPAAQACHPTLCLLDQAPGLGAQACCPGRRLPHLCVQSAGWILLHRAADMRRVAPIPTQASCRRPPHAALLCRWRKAACSWRSPRWWRGVPRMLRPARDGPACRCCWPWWLSPCCNALPGRRCCTAAAAAPALPAAGQASLLPQAGSEARPAAQILRGVAAGLGSAAPNTGMHRSVVGLLHDREPCGHGLSCAQQPCRDGCMVHARRAQLSSRGWACRWLLESCAGRVALQGLVVSSLDPKDAGTHAVLSDAAALLLQVRACPDRLVCAQAACPVLDKPVQRVHQPAGFAAAAVHPDCTLPEAASAAAAPSGKEGEPACGCTCRSAAAAGQRRPRTLSARQQRPRWASRSRARCASPHALPSPALAGYGPHVPPPPPAPGPEAHLHRMRAGGCERVCWEAEPAAPVQAIVAALSAGDQKQLKAALLAVVSSQHMQARLSGGSTNGHMEMMS